MLKIIFNIIFYLALFGIVANCSEEPNYDADVEIVAIITQAVSSPHESKVTRYAEVKYCVENTCENDIHGWEIFFNVALNRGPNITASDNIYYTLEPGGISEVQTAMTPIPSYYEDARNASLKNIEIW